MLRLFVLAVFAIAGVLPFGMRMAVAQTVDEIEQRVLAQRRDIRSCELEISSQIWYLERGELRQRPDLAIHIWFDPEGHRNDLVGGLAWQRPDEKPIRRLYSLSSGKLTDWTDQQPPGGGSVVVSLRDPTQLDAFAKQLIDPRTIGIVPESLPNLVRHHLESTVGRFDRDPPTLEKVLLNGEECLKVEFQTKHKAICRYWVAPHKDYSVLRCEMQFESQEGQYLDMVQCGVDRNEPSAVWFPTSFSYERRLNDVVQQRQVAQIKVLSFNLGVDPAAFTLAGMSIPAGHLVHDLTSADHPFHDWNGNELVARSPNRSILEVAKDELHWQRVYIYGSIALVCVAASGLLLWRYAAARRAATG